MSIYHRLMKPLLFRMDAETAHYRTMTLLRFASGIAGGQGMLKRQFTFDHEHLSKRVMGIDFQNPVGLAAGFAKDGKWIDLLTLLGFGCDGVGTVSPSPQDG